MALKDILPELRREHSLTQEQLAKKLYITRQPEHYCQSCGMMFTGPGQHGHEADGTETQDYCRWCYEDGAYTYETTMDDMIEECAPRMAEAMGWTVDESASLLGAVLPTLDRWKE